MSELNIFGVIASVFCGISLAVWTHWFFAALLLKIPDHPLEKATDFVIKFIPVELFLVIFVGTVVIDICYGLIILLESLGGDIHQMYFHLFWISLTLYAMVFLPRYVFKRLIRAMFPERVMENQ